jgi:hypothetical protein
LLVVIRARAPSRILLCAGSLLASTSLAAPVFADDPCVDAHAQGQIVRKAHQLVEASEQFHACAQQMCPAMVQKDCVVWLDEVEKSLATVVLTVEDRAATELARVDVRVDGRPLPNALDGRALRMNPGPHAFHFFDTADGSSLDQQVIVTEGERNRGIAVVLGRIPPPSRAQPSGLRTAGWVLGGLGVVGLGVGTVAGVVAIGDKGSAHCVNDVCASGPLAGARSAAAVSDAGLVAGGVLLAGGVALLVLSRSGGRENRPSASVAPLVAAHGGGLAVGGCF